MLEGKIGLDVSGLLRKLKTAGRDTSLSDIQELMGYLGKSTRPLHGWLAAKIEWVNELLDNYRHAGEKLQRIEDSWPFELDQSEIDTELKAIEEHLTKKNYDTAATKLSELKTALFGSAPDSAESITEPYNSIRRIFDSYDSVVENLLELSSDEGELHKENRKLEEQLENLNDQARQLGSPRGY